MILGVVRRGRSAVAAYAVGGYIAAAYWFTSSTSFANPAVTIARTLTNTFAGIAPEQRADVRRDAGGRRVAAVALARFWHPTLHSADLVDPNREEPS